MSRVVVLGSSGFVGSAACLALEARGHQVIRIRAPRIGAPTDHTIRPGDLTQLQKALLSSDALVNAAGIPDATGKNTSALDGANAILPGLLARQCETAGVRFVHVSSAAVQGRKQTLDSTTEYHPFSPYSVSKVKGEIAALRHQDTVVYRPPGVHGPSRDVTKAIARVARSRFASVAGRGDANSAQALIENVGDAIAFLAVCHSRPPSIVSHPSEGISTAELMRALGGRNPVSLPVPAVRILISAAFAGSAVYQPMRGHARRLEMLWLGQDQAPSWLTDAGWEPPLDRTAWYMLGGRLAQDPRSH